MIFAVGETKGLSFFSLKIFNVIPVETPMVKFENMILWNKKRVFISSLHTPKLLEYLQRN